MIDVAIFLAFQALDIVDIINSIPFPHTDFSNCNAGEAFYQTKF